VAVSETAVGWGILLAVTSVTAAVVVNGVMGNYEDGKGQAYGAASNVASVSVASIAAEMVSPKQQQPSPAQDAATSGSVATRTFTITNDSNIPEQFVISNVTTNGGTLSGVAYTPSGAAPITATVGTTTSPIIPPGQSLTVSVSVSTAGAAIGASFAITLTVKTVSKAANGQQTDTGTAWVWVARGPEISGQLPASTVIPAGGASPIPVVEQVNGSSAAAVEPGAALTLRLPFENVGDSGASGLTANVTLPAQLRAIPGSFSLQATDAKSGKNVTTTVGGSVSLNGNTIVATIPSVAPGIDIALSYGATLSASAALGTTLTDASTIGAQALPAVSPTPAAILVGAMNTVYDGVSGGGHPVAGATVTLLDSASGQPINLGAGGASARNPDVTGQSGTFAFALPSTGATQTDYVIDVTAAGFLNRRIKLALKSSGPARTTATLTALDGLPMAVAGGFDLTSSAVAVSDIPNFFGNVPLFSPQAIMLSIALDKSVASAGSRLAYNVAFGPGSKPLPGPAQLTIALPAGITYAHGTARLNALPVDPGITDRTLTVAVKDLVQSRTLTFDAVMLPGVADGATLGTHAHLSETLRGGTLTSDANVSVAVGGGALGARTILTGRVFADHAHDGHFAPGDTGVANVRIFLEDGESALTDRDGRFSFPAARPGQHVLHLDPVTLPPGLHPYHGFAVNDPRSSMRLVHGIMDSGLMDDVNFAVSDAAGK
jgi:hypothetical protein